MLADVALLVALRVTALLSAFNYLWPLALIAGGGFLLWRALGRRRRPEPVGDSDERALSAGEETSSR